MILVGGENLIDLLENPDGGFSATPGGGPFNIARTLGHLGQNAGYLSPISKDPMGDRLAGLLEANGVTLLAPRSNAPSSLALISLLEGEPRYRFYREKTAERRVSLSMLNRIIPASASALQLGSLALASGTDAGIWAQIYVAFHKRGKFTALDPNIRPSFIKQRRRYLARLDWMLAHTDLLKLSDADLGWISPDQPVDIAAQTLQQKHGISLLVVTKGSKGATAYHASGSLTVLPSAPTPFVDAIGAGDTFMGTLLAKLSTAGLLEREALKNTTATALLPCLKAAALAAAINCESAGCNPPDAAAMAKRQQ
ncbi:MAG: PfkB family carbohydrate kinase [Rhodobacteraceae bacterium]|nr:PfkB family carbohydrate kinase [Paracoccaceae bacterium]